MKSEFLIKAKDNLNAAQMCFENGFYDSCANRAYYAVFHAAIAALADRGIKRDKIDHKQIQADFCEKLIKRQKVYPAQVKSYLMDMQSVRNQADYTTESISRNLAHKQINKAKEMILLIERKLEK
ncbi:MAG TPA: HEPN domain-containing protein [Thermodesulfovibrionia bacterium]|nr:HEPN domain-containing protein [Thermodesulfovibrionia bacterium]